jgi:hypothetical protein
VSINPPPKKKGKDKIPQDIGSSQALILSKLGTVHANEKEEDFNVVPSIPSSLLPHADDLYIYYTRTHLLRGVSDSLQKSDLSNKPMRPGRSNQFSKAFREGLPVRCFLAIATTYFGRQTGKQDVCLKGMQRYGKALKDLNVALADDQMSKSLEVLDSVITMAFYEVGSCLSCHFLITCKSQSIGANVCSSSSRTIVVAGLGILGA